MIKFLYGDEPYLIEKEKRALLNQIQMPEVNLMRFDAWGKEVFTYLSTYPLMDEFKLAIIECANLSSFGNSSFSKYLENPFPSSTLLVIVESIDARTKLAKQLKEKGFLQECNILRNQSELKKILLEEIHKRGGTISEDAYTHFLQREQYVPDGNRTLLNLISDLDRLISYQPEITAQTIDLLVEENIIVKAFSIADMIASHNLSGLRKQANAITGAGTDEIFKCIGAILYGLKLAWKCQYYSKKDIGVWNNQEIGYGFYSKAQLQQAIRFVVDVRAGLMGGNNPLPSSSAMEYIFLKLVAIEREV